MARAKEAAARREPKNPEGLFRDAVQATVLLDRRREIQGFNPAAEALTGWAADEVLGMACHQVLGCPCVYSVRLQKLLCPGIEALEGRRPLPGNRMTVATKRGELTPVVASYSPGRCGLAGEPLVVLALRPDGAREAGSPARAPEQVQAGELRIDLRRHEVWRGRECVPLTPLEFDLLYMFAVHAGTALTRERLLNVVWGIGESPATNVVDVHVKLLRDKIEPDPRRPRYIETLRGFGYRFQEAR